MLIGYIQTASHATLTLKVRCCLHLLQEQRRGSWDR